MTFLNNFKNATTRKTFNEIIYEKKFRDFISLISKNVFAFEIDIFEKKKLYQKDAIEIIVFEHFEIKIRYDNKYQFLRMKQNDEIYLKFHLEYKISKLNNIKFNNVKTKFSRIKKAHEQ